MAHAQINSVTTNIQIVLQTRKSKPQNMYMYITKTPKNVWFLTVNYKSLNSFGVVNKQISDNWIFYYMAGLHHNSECQIVIQKACLSELSIYLLFSLWYLDCKI